MTFDYVIYHNNEALEGGRVFRDMVHLFKGTQNTFENFEWSSRDIGIQRFLDFGDTCSKCYMILGILSKYFKRYRIFTEPPPPPPLPGPK